MGYVLIALGLISLVVGAIAAFGRDTNASDQKRSPEALKLYASYVIKAGGELRQAALRYGDIYGFGGMTYATVAGSAIGLDSAQFNFPAEMNSGAAITTEIVSADFSAVTGYTATSKAVRVQNLDAQICATINAQLYGSGANPAAFSVSEFCDGGAYYRALRPGV